MTIEAVHTKWAHDLYTTSTQRHDLNKTSHQRRCSIMTLYNVTFMLMQRINIMCTLRRDQADLTRHHQQEMRQQQVFAVPTRGPPVSAAARFASQLQSVMYHEQQQQKEFQLATIIAVSALPHHSRAATASSNGHPVSMPATSHRPAP